MLNGSTILCTGGTGSLGRALVKRICTDYEPKKVIVLSRDEFKQSQMQRDFQGFDNLRFFLGDVRDKDRLNQVFSKVDYVIHAAALKQIPALEYNPKEGILTNINGTMNVVDACIANHVQRAVLISTDKAVNPINLYGATKLAAEKLFMAANSYCRTKFCGLRYGNVLNSRGSVIEYFLELKKKGIREFPITDERMTRFWLTLEEAVDLVLDTLAKAIGEIVVPRIPSMKIVDIARAIEPKAEFKITGIRPGEKLHECLDPPDYTSDNNDVWLTPEALRGKLGLVDPVRNMSFNGVEVELDYGLPDG